MPDITDLAEQYFVDLERDRREDTDENLAAWLWFRCPANLRDEVRAGVQQLREEKQRGWKP